MSEKKCGNCVHRKPLKLKTCSVYGCYHPGSSNSARGGWQSLQSCILQDYKYFQALEIAAEIEAGKILDAAHTEIDRLKGLINEVVKHCNDEFKNDCTAKESEILDPFIAVILDILCKARSEAKGDV